MSGGVKVAVRVRPFNEREKNLNAVCCIDMVIIPIKSRLEHLPSSTMIQELRESLPLIIVSGLMMDLKMKNQATASQ
jgi:hypothetical protein